MKFINQHSFVLFAGTLLSIMGVSVVRSGVTLLRVIIFAGLFLGLAVTYLLLRPEATKSQDTAEIGIRIGTGIPMLLEFLSPY